MQQPPYTKLASQITVSQKAVFEGHRDAVYALLPHPEHSSKFFSVSGDGLLVLWDIEHPEQGKLIAKAEQSIFSVAFIELGVLQKYLIVGRNFSGLSIIDLISEKLIANISLEGGYIFSISPFTKNTIAYALVGLAEGLVYLVNISEKKVVKRFALGNGSVRCMAMLEHKEQIFLSGSDGHLWLYNIDSEKISLVKESIHENSVFSLLIDDSGEHLFSTGRDAKICKWQIITDNNTIELIEKVPAHNYTINTLSLSADGKFLASGSKDKSIKIWDASSMRLLKVIDKGRFASHGTSVNNLCWSSYNNLLLSASDDRKIIAWSIDL